jgi:high affinity Mn2+ porin
MRNPRALPLLALVASLAASPAFATETAQPAGANVAQLLQAMQERLTRLEARNAELERRLAEPAKLPEQVGTRLDEVENEVLALSKKPDPLAKFDGISVGASLLMVAQYAKGGAASATELSTRADVEVELPGGSIGNAEGRIIAHFLAGDSDGLDGAVTLPAAAPVAKKSTNCSTPGRPTTACKSRPACNSSTTRLVLARMT